jgi:2-aminoadipate transaminase
LAERKRSGKRMPKFLYTIPTYHNPSGTTMPLERRLALLELARQYDFLIVEDDAYNSLGWGDPPPAALRTLDTDNRVIYLTTLSKTVGPGVRAGWALAHPDLIWQMQRIKTDGVQAFSHSTVMAYLSQIDFTARIAWLRSEYQVRCETMLTALEAEMPAGVRWSRPSGGFFIWLEFADGRVNTNQLAIESNAAGCTFIPGESFYTDGAGTHALRLSFSFATPEEIRRGIEILASVIRAHVK